MKFVPTFVSHLERYVYALNFCYKRKVIDLGAKDGFGTQILSYGAREITHVDINDKFIAGAKYQKYHCKTDFIKCDLEKDFPLGEYETATAFEIIEHLENPEFFIKNIAEHLVSGGIFVFSVPHMVANHEHKVLFDEEKIKELIGKYFNIDEFYVQERHIFSNNPMYKGLKVYLGKATKK